MKTSFHFHGECCATSVLSVSLSFSFWTITYSCLCFHNKSHHFIWQSDVVKKIYAEKSHKVCSKAREPSTFPVILYFTTQMQLTKSSSNVPFILSLSHSHTHSMPCCHALIRFGMWDCHVFIGKTHHYHSHEAQRSHDYVDDDDDVVDIAPILSILCATMCVICEQL